MTFAGIDPGYRQGGVGLVQGHWAEVHDLPCWADGGVDCKNLIDILRSVDLELCIIEKQSARPGQGVASSFKIGMGFGQVLACCDAVGLRYKLVTPAKWKRAFSVPADKDGARRLAQQLYPRVSDHLKLKKHEHRAEALLMAAYAEAIG